MRIYSHAAHHEPARPNEFGRTKNDPRRSGDRFDLRCDVGLGCRRHDADDGLLVGALDSELDLAVDEREQRVVLADTDVDAGVHFGPALADDDGSRGDRLAAEGFDAEPFGLRIAAVARAAARLLCAMSGYLSVLRFNRRCRRS